MTIRQTDAHQKESLTRPVTGIHPYLRFAVDKGISTELVLKRTELDKSIFFDPQQEILLEQEMVIVRNLMDLLPAPETAWELGRYFYSKAHGILGGMMEAVATLGEVISCWVDFSILLNVWFRLNLEMISDKIRLHAENQYHLPEDLLPFLVERDIMAGKTAVDHRLPGTFEKYTTAISFAHKPRAPIEKYKEYFIDTIHFNQPDSYVEITKASLSAPLPGSDPHKLELFRQQCQAELSLRSESRLFLSDKVKMHLQSEKGQISLSDIAQRLNMSERSVRQKLSREGNNFRKIRNQYIFQQSLYLLGNPELTVEEISDTLGYSETCAFCRAFEKWAGMPPGRYRKITLE